MQEKDQVIEITQEELAECRTELNALKTAPVAGSKKGMQFSKINLNK